MRQEWRPSVTILVLALLGGVAGCLPGQAGRGEGDARVESIPLKLEYADLPAEFRQRLDKLEIQAVLLRGRDVRHWLDSALAMPAIRPAPPAVEDEIYFAVHVTAREAVDILHVEWCFLFVDNKTGNILFGLTPSDFLDGTPVWEKGRTLYQLDRAGWSLANYEKDRDHMTITLKVKSMEISNGRTWKRY